MKKMITIILSLVLLCATFSGCGRIEAASSPKVPDFRQELLDLGFVEPKDAYSTAEIPIWQVGIGKNNVIYVMRTIEGNWVYDPYFEKDLDQIAEICCYPNAYRLVGLVYNAKTLTFRVHVNNSEYFGFRDWKMVEKDRWGGGGSYDFYKVSSETWDPRTSSAEWDGGGYIPDISMDTIRKMAAERFKDDPYGQNTEELADDFLLACVWDFEKGELIE